MSSVQIITTIEAADVGGENARVEGNHSETLTIGAAWSNITKLTAAVAAALETLWDATLGGNPATFQKLAIYVDPDDEAASVLDVLVEVRVNAAILVFTVNRTAPLIFTKQAADTALPASGAAASTINRIRAANHNAVLAANDVKIRVVIYR